MEAREKYNLGLELIRLIMCYAVVATHFWNYWTFYPHGGAPWPLEFVKTMRGYAVPVFMLMTFYLSSAHFLAADGAWTLRRFRRLLVPFVGWTVVTFVVFKALTPFSSEFACTWRDLGWQQLLGTTKALGAQMWFQAVLIILTAIFALVFRLVRPAFAVRTLVLIFLGVVALEYSGLNFWLFKDGIYEVRNPLGRVIPMMAYAAVGILLGLRRAEFAKLTLGVRWLTVAAGLSCVAFIVNFPVFVEPEGFYYRGLNMLAIAVALLAVFGLLPTERVPDRVARILLVFSRYSMGVYFVHILLGRILTVFLYPLLGLKAGCFAGTFVVYLVCWAFCFLLAKVLPRPLQDLVK